MREVNQLERTFVSRVVEDTEFLIQSDLPTIEKISKLQAWVKEHAKKANELRQYRPSTEPDLRSKNMIRSIVTLREKAVCYLRATAVFLSHNEEYELSYRQRPRLFAMVDWGKGDRRTTEGKSITDSSIDLTS